MRKYKSVERSDLLNLSVFWAIHYYLLIGTEDVDSADLVEPIFGLGNEFTNGYYVEHFDKTPWPCFRISMPRRFAVEVEYALEPDSETRFKIDHDDWESPVVLGYESGHSAMPAFRWAEVVQIGKCISMTTRTPAHRRSGLLLLFPGVYITPDDDKSDIGSTLRRAWSELELIDPNNIHQLVGYIIENGSTDTRWWNDTELGWINDSPYSLRNPFTQMCAFDRGRFDKITAFFGMVEEFTCAADDWEND